MRVDKARGGKGRGRWIEKEEKDDNGEEKEGREMKNEEEEGREERR